MIDLKAIKAQLASPPKAGSPDALRAAMAAHLEAMRIPQPPATTIQDVEPTEADLALIELTDGRNGTWSDYYANSPDFFGLAHLNRGLDLVEASRVEPRALLGLVAMLAEREAKRYESYARTLIDLDAAGCRSFWVGRRGVLAQAEDRP